MVGDAWLRYWWALSIAVIVLNVLIVLFEARRQLAADTSLARESKILMVRFAALLCLPWIIMAMGQVFGRFPTILHVARPQDGDPWVLAWWLTNFIGGITIAHWVGWRGGADTLSRHPELSRGKAVPANVSKRAARLWVFTSVPVSVVAMALLWYADLQLLLPR